MKAYRTATSASNRMAVSLGELRARWALWAKVMKAYVRAVSPATATRAVSHTGSRCPGTGITA